MSTLRAAVAGATGYIGIQCVGLLEAHPQVELTRLLARTHAGRRFGEVVLGSTLDLPLEPGLDPGDADVVFAALPHTVAASQARDWLSRGALVIDLSADFRLRDVRAYEQWYKVEHPAPELCDEAVYALPELGPPGLRDANLLAAPGCYPTAGLLATVPALRAGLIEPALVIDAKSGVSGAGRSASMTVHFSEVNESVRAYSVSGHRHKAELLQGLRSAAGSDVQVTFVPHLIPMTRGILATAYLRPLAAPQQIEACYRDFAAQHPCLRYDEEPPPTKSVTGSNTAAINVTTQDGAVIVTVAIDNLVKGAAGQAVQALNLRQGWEETMGLPLAATWP